MIKSISFIVLTQFFHFNELKILRQPFKPTIFFTVLMKLKCKVSKFLVQKEGR